MSGKITYQLHHLADALQNKYDVLSHLLGSDLQGNYKSSFLIGKSNLAPVLAMTILSLPTQEAFHSV